MTNEEAEDLIRAVNTLVNAKIDLQLCNGVCEPDPARITELERLVESCNFVLTRILLSVQR